MQIYLYVSIPPKSMPTGETEKPGGLDPGASLLGHFSACEMGPRIEGSWCGYCAWANNRDPHFTKAKLPTAVAEYLTCQ